MGWTDLIPGAGVVKTIAGIGGEYLEGKREKTRQKHKRQVAELDLEREIVRSTTGWCRLFALAFLFGPDAALLLPWITAADIGAYYDALATAQPEWRANAKEYIVLAMWGGAELANGTSALTKQRRRRKEEGDKPTGPDTPGAP